MNSRLTALSWALAMLAVLGLSHCSRPPRAKRSAEGAGTRNLTRTQSMGLSTQPPAPPGAMDSPGTPSPEPVLPPTAVERPGVCSLSFFFAAGLLDCNFKQCPRQQAAEWVRYSSGTLVRESDNSWTLRPQGRTPPFQPQEFLTLAEARSGWRVHAPEQAGSETVGSCTVESIKPRLMPTGSKEVVRAFGFRGEMTPP